MSVFTQTAPNWMERFGIRKRPITAGHAAPASPAGLAQVLVGVWRGLLSLQAARTSTRRLRLVEKISLGDKHFVALLEIDGVSFLASSGGSGALTLTAAHDLQANADGRADLAAFQNRHQAPVGTESTTPSFPSGDWDGDGGQAVTGNSAEPYLDRAGFGAAAFAAKASKPQSRAKAVHSAGKSAAKLASKNGASAHAGQPPQLSKLIAATPEPVKGEKVRAQAQPLSKQVRAANAASALKPAKAASSAPKLDTAVEKAPRTRPAVKAAKPASRSTTAPIATAASKTRRMERLVSPVPTVGSRTAGASDWAALSTPPLTAPPIPARQEDPEQGQGINAANRFAALLELRMLASEVFAEIDSKQPVANTPQLPASEPPAPRARRTESPISTGFHRLRRRLGGLACLGFVFFAAHGTLHAQSLPAPHALATLQLPGAAPTLGYATAATTSLLAVLPSSGAGDIHITGLGGSSASWSIVVLLTILTLIPALLMCVTPFARLLIVFHFLRQALGLQTTPSNQTLIGLSLIMTFFLMQPVGEVIYRDAILPAQAGKLTPLDAVVRAGDPLRHFMARFVREKDAELFLEIAKEPRPRTVDDLSFRVLLPSYILSELKAGFQIGTVLFLPFLIVDMVVASITTSVGMMQLPPVVISTPLKLLLFLMVDGWHLLIGALMRSFS